MLIPPLGLCVMGSLVASSSLHFRTTTQFRINRCNFVESLSVYQTLSVLLVDRNSESPIYMPFRQLALCTIPININRQVFDRNRRSPTYTLSSLSALGSLIYHHRTIPTRDTRMCRCSFNFILVRRSLSQRYARSNPYFWRLAAHLNLSANRICFDRLQNHDFCSPVFNTSSVDVSSTVMPSFCYTTTISICRIWESNPSFSASPLSVFHQTNTTLYGIVLCWLTVYPYSPNDFYRQYHY